MNALIVVALATAVWFGLLVAWVARRDRRLRTPLLALGAALAVGAVVFVVINPTLYPDLPSGLRGLFEEHRLTSEIQDAFLGGRLRTWPVRALAVVRLVCGRLAWSPVLAVAVLVQTAASLRRPSDTTLVVLWWWIAFLALSSWLPLAWGRYALPLVPPSALLVAKTLDEAGAALLRGCNGSSLSGSRR
jgi:hypothetical protein